MEKDLKFKFGVQVFFFLCIYINDLHNIQITTDKHNHQIP